MREQRKLYTKPIVVHYGNITDITKATLTGNYTDCNAQVHGSTSGTVWGPDSTCS